MTGSSSGKERKRIMSDFCKKKLDVFFTSRAGKVGMDLLGAAAVILKEPSENLSTERQIVNRVNRYDSHKKEPREKRKVDVFRFLSSFPTQPTVSKLSSEDKSMLKFLLADLFYPSSSSSSELSFHTSSSATSAMGKITDKDIQNVLNLIHSHVDERVTIEQVLFYRNIAKQKLLNPILDAIQHASNPL